MTCYLWLQYYLLRIYEKHSRECIKYWRRGDHHSSLKHMKFNIQKTIIMFWVEEFQEMVHFIIINWFDQSGVGIWNRFRVTLIWKIWRVNLNITIINGMMIKPPMIAETKGLVWGEEILYLKWAGGGWLFHYLGGSVGESPWRALNWLIFILILGGINLGLWMMQASAEYCWRRSDCAQYEIHHHIPWQQHKIGCLHRGGVVMDSILI